MFEGSVPWPGPVPASNNVERGDWEGTVRQAQVAVKNIARVTHGACDCPHRVHAVGEGALVRACAPARSVDGGGEGAVGSAQKAVSHSVRVKVVSRNCPNVVDHKSEGTLLRPRACTRSVECDDWYR